MKVFRAEIWCDGCGAEYDSGAPFEDASPQSYRRRARALAACAVAAGWVSPWGDDYCPACRPKIVEGESFPMTDAHLPAVMARANEKWAAGEELTGDNVDLAGRKAAKAGEL